MKVLLVNPVTRNVSLSSPDLGLGYLAGALKKKNHQVHILDCVNGKMTFDQFADYITALDVDVIGFRVFSTDLFSVKKSVQIVKEKLPDVIVILGGAHPSAFPEQTLQYFEEADFAIRGEAEQGLADFMKYLSDRNAVRKDEIPGLIWRENGEIICNPPLFFQDLDALVSPDWDLINPRDYPFQTSYFTRSKIVAPLIMTRGCPYHCTFCSCRAVTGHKIRAHSVPYIINQIKFLQSKFGIKEVCFIDDNFLALKTLVTGLCEQIIEQKIDIKWSCFGIRLDLVDEQVLRLMEKAGCYLITVGIESGSQRILDHMKKKLTLELVGEKLQLIKTRTGIKVIGNFILGYPVETEEDIRKTIRFAGKLPLYGANFFPFHPTPGTEIFDWLTAQKKLGEIPWESMGQDRKPYIPEGISRKKFTWLFILAFMNFYLRPKIILNVLTATRSPEKIKYIVSRVIRIIG
ncbi:MAG TPA: cobalamin-dependent protein [Smithella sp.]|nr:cobalamin-dependent protein [Smithella sp.]